jgi:hypothetical protein
LIAIFSYEKKNYLYLAGHLIELSQNIYVECYIAQSMRKESWLKVFDNDKLIFEIQYINPHEPFILPDPFFPDEDYKTTNFAHHIYEYIQKVKENPDIVLFPGK